MEKITRSKALELMLSLLGGNTFVGVMATTVPKMRKTGNPWYDNVKKTTSVGGCLLHNYEANVNAQRAREGKPTDFVAQASKWGKRIGNSCIFAHTPKGATVEKHYLDLRILKVSRSRLFTKDGTRISMDTIKPWQTPRKKSEKQNLRKEIVIRRYMFSNIRRINVSCRDEHGKVVSKRRLEIVDD